mmetsp:Transcript_14208/g.19751  ORF Transcript_14208/g.19751 Transcript_14208/m.19751 type:complete len:108 (-) Transcript_14208:258-581(-)
MKRSPVIRFPTVDATLVAFDSKTTVYMFCGARLCTWDLREKKLLKGPEPITSKSANFAFPRLDAVLRFPAHVGPTEDQDVAFMFYQDRLCEFDLESNELKDKKPKKL